MNRVVLISLAIMLIATGVSAGTDEEDSVGVETYRLLLNNGESFHVYQGKLTEQGVEGVTRLDSAVVVPREDIHSLYRYGGSGAKKGAHTGALVGLGAAVMVYLMAVSEASGDSSVKVDNGKAMQMSVGFVAVGAVIGGLIGSASSNWQRVSLKYGTAYGSSGNDLGVTLSWSF